MLPGAFSGTGVNLTGNSNSLNSWIGEIDSRTSNLSVVFNLAGSYNSISDSLSCPLITNASGGIGLKVIGNFNGASGTPSASGNQENPVTFLPEISPPIYIATNQMSAPGGRIYIAPSANGNVIEDDSFDLTAQPTVYLSNGTANTPTTSWYFFNSSWSPSGGNRNVSIYSSSPWIFPLAGNISLVAGFSNVTGQSTDIIQNNSLSLDTSTDATSGESSGSLLTNDTSSLNFSSISAVVPVGMAMGNNTYLDVYGNTVSTLGSLGYVTILDFDPYHSLPGENFNETQTTNWGSISDFRTVPNLTFVVENPTTHALLGNVSYDQNLSLLAQGIDSGLSIFGNNFDISSTGNSTNFTMTNTTLNLTFNSSATLTMYPNNFPFASSGNITIVATTDAGSATTIFDKGALLNQGAGFVAPSQTPTVVADTSITLPILQFSKFDFFETDPVASFTSSTTFGYEPLAVQFNDTSTFNPTGWNWSFGDGTWFNTTDTTQRNVTHIFGSAGSFPVFLTASDVGGSNITSPIYINVSASLPIPVFTGTPTFGYEPLNVQFNDSTPSTGILYWNWSFGDNNWFNTTDSTLRNISHPYSSVGSYTVNLSITNQSGLSSPAIVSNTTSIANYINVSSPPPIPSFTSNTTFGYVPLGVQFNDTTVSMNILYWNWSFGDNTWFNTTVSALRNISHPYSSIGSYTVNLSITNSTGLSVPATNTNTTSIANYINVSSPPPIPSFTSNTTSGYVPLGIQFNDTTVSTNIQYWNWSFGDNTWFNTTDDMLRNATHQYVSSGSYTVNLSVTNLTGLSFPATNTNTTSIANYIDALSLPIPDFTGSPRSGNATLNVQFNDTSTPLGIILWNWSFGDNTWFNTTNSILRNATHTYQIEGAYTVNLSLTNSSGTNTTYQPGYIVVYPPLPIPAFIGSPTSGSIPLFVQFNDTSPSPGITIWNWSFGDNTWFNTTDSTARNASHTYSAIGSFTVNLTITNTTGVNTTSMSGYIRTTPPPPSPHLPLHR